MNYSRKVQVVTPKNSKFREMILSREGVLIPKNGRVSSRNRITSMSSNKICENQDIEMKSTCSNKLRDSIKLNQIGNVDVEMQDFNFNVKIDENMNGDIANHSLNNDFVMQSPKVEKISKVIEYDKYGVPKISSRYIKLSSKIFCVTVAFDKELNFDNIDCDYYQTKRMPFIQRPNCKLANSRNWKDLFGDSLGFFRFGIFHDHLNAVGQYFINLFISRRQLICGLKLFLRLKIFVQSFVYLLYKIISKTWNQDYPLIGKFKRAVFMKKDMYSSVLFQAAEISRLPFGYIANFLPNNSVLFINPDNVRVLLENGKSDQLYNKKDGILNSFPSLITTEFIKPRRCKLKCFDGDLNREPDLSQFSKKLYSDTIMDNSNAAECAYFKQHILLWCRYREMKISESFDEIEEVVFNLNENNLTPMEIDIEPYSKRFKNEKM